MSPVQFDPEAIRSLANILRDTGLTEIELAVADSRIRLVRAVAASAPAPGPAPVQRAPEPAAAPAPAEGEEEALPEGAVLSPMVGIAYLGPEPGSPPFVMPGQTVTAGQTVMLIEAMKTFNQIKAPRAGTVTQILVVSGQPVEYGQALLVVE